MSSAPRAIRTSILALTSATLLAACGGGGDSAGNGGPVGGSPAAPAPAPAPVPAPAPPANRDPVLGLPVVSQSGIRLHPFDFDVTQGGRTFTDADGDELAYTVTFDLDNIGGLRIEGSRIVGIPQVAGIAIVRVSVTDRPGSFAATQFLIRVDPNRSPAVATAPDDLIVAIGSPVDVDATAAGTLQFRDEDGDPLTYEVSVRGAPGLSVDGSRVHGSLANVGAVEVSVTARDSFGGEGLARFLVAAAAPEPGAPTLPATSYVYEDAQLAMPEVMRLELQFHPLFPENQPTNAGATLGRVLFHDKRLSITNTVACANCHQQSHGFASPNRFDRGVLDIPLKRNAMTLGNSRANGPRGWFSDMRVSSLRDVARAALTSTEEMGAKLPRVEAKLRATGFYAPLFAEAFGSPEITGERVLLALEQYVESVITYRSKFDRVCLPMDNSPVDCSAGFTAQELRGQEIFENNNQIACTSCHQRWSMSNVWHANNGLDDVVTDPGILDPVFRRDGSQGVFRAASLRNIARTAPYMHDGRFATLRDVIDHYDHGVKPSANLDDFLGGRNTGVASHLNISDSDKDALEAFLLTLTDEAVLTDPKFSDPFL
jgi:cytochrome c peroxidase